MTTHGSRLAIARAAPNMDHSTLRCCGETYQVLFDESLPDMSSLQEGQRRVLILSERRSGGQAVGTVLNADSRVFYVGDPCRMGGGPEALEGMGCATMVSRLLACQPTINDVRNLFSFSYIVERVSFHPTLFHGNFCLQRGRFGRQGVNLSVNINVMHTLSVYVGIAPWESCSKLLSCSLVSRFRVWHTSNFRLTWALRDLPWCVQCCGLETHRSNGRGFFPMGNAL